MFHIPFHQLSSTHNDQLPRSRTFKKQKESIFIEEAPQQSNMNFSTQITSLHATGATTTPLTSNDNAQSTGHYMDGDSQEIGSFTPSVSQILLGIKSQSITNSSRFETIDNVTTEEINQFYFYETEQFTVLWVLFAVIVLGNSAVLVTLFINKSRKSRMNFFIRHLAIADLSVGLLNVLTDIIWRITVTWRAGNLACKFIKFLQCLVTYASTYVLVALSIDRYDAITHPMNFSGSWKRAKILVLSAWALSAIFSTPQFILYEETQIQGRTQCWIELGEQWRWQVYMTLVSIVLFFIPALIISLCYAIIVKTIWSKGTYMGSKEHRNGDKDDDRGSRRASSRGIIPRAKVKTVKMTFVIVIVFVLCWSPYIVFDLLQVFDQIPKTQTNIAVATFIQSLAPLNSAANPLIYCLFSAQVLKTFRRTAFFRWISKLCHCNDTDLENNQFPNGRTRNGQRNPNQNYDSMRTLTTSLTTSRKSTTCLRATRVVIIERQKSIHAPTDEIIEDQR